MLLPSIVGLENVVLLSLDGNPGLTAGSWDTLATRRQHLISKKLGGDVDLEAAYSAAGVPICGKLKAFESMCTNTGE